MKRGKYRKENCRREKNWNEKDRRGKYRKGKYRRGKRRNDKYTEWLISDETQYFFDFFLIYDRLGLIFISHILWSTRETVTLPRLRGWTYRTIFVKSFVLKIFYKGVFLSVISLFYCLNKSFVRSPKSFLNFGYPVFLHFCTNSYT
jgi:hypothetical protein